jgi:ribosomal protein S3
MNNLEIETKRESIIIGNEGKNILEIEDPRESVITGEQTSLTIQKKDHSKITLYLTEPKSIIITQRSDTTETYQV